eukprot:CAMPEP_0202847022 /NCGR_PEP_ID=MMETSP1389-20130828/74396_1 /ASSEMBLY_ACC=CAM_ASM_000865 /TAXON_ID=302021 /ORGANISM="Rhodomonas sp., Strain CCMP768" /LENGTH=343 /DNA_ID=CAMNT_0049524669 /DNA_START=53 /DNA_END=1084 /DNA_ORIENTATION=+
MASQLCVGAIFLFFSSVWVTLAMEDEPAPVDTNQRAKNAIVGALVGDAASMGLHWIYDEKKLAKMVRSKGLLTSKRAPEFFEPPASPFYNYPSGSQTPYGDEVYSLLHSLAEHDNFDAVTFADESIAASQKYPGRLNKVMKEFVETKTGSTKNMQAHGMVKAPIVAARYAGSQTNRTVASVAKAAAEVHQALEEPVEIAVVSSRILELVILGRSVEDAFQETMKDCRLSLWARAVLKDALEYDGGNPVAHFGKSSTLPGAFQGAAVLLRRATSYEQVMRDNILAGGDSASRAMWVGAVMGAAHGVPKQWKSKVTHLRQIEQLADQIVARREADSALEDREMLA